MVVNRTSQATVLWYLSKVSFCQRTSVFHGISIPMRQSGVTLHEGHDGEPIWQLDSRTGFKLPSGITGEGDRVQFVINVGAKLELKYHRLRRSPSPVISLGNSKSVSRSKKCHFIASAHRAAAKQ